MTALFFWNGLAALVAWLIVLERLLSVLRRQPHLSPIARQQVWLFWSSFFGFAIAVTVDHPFVHQLLAVSGWFRDVPQTILAIAVYIIGVQICYSFAPVFRPRWNWPLYVGVGVIAADVFLSWATWAWPVVSSLAPAKTALPRLVFNTFLLVLLGRIVLPAYVWAWRHERQRPMRLRFKLIAGMHALIATWLLIGIGEIAAWVLGGLLNLTIVYVILGVFITLLFAAHLAPMSFFVHLAAWLDYPQDVTTYCYVRVLESQAARWLNRTPISFHGPTVVRDPAKAVYQLVVAIFDMRKLLRQSDYAEARALSLQLDAFAQAELDYDATVARLRALGRVQVRHRLVNRLSWPLAIRALFGAQE